jgi:SAM-dependent methyltransferase
MGRKGSGKHKRGKKGRAKGRTLAQKADRYDLYQRSVNEPDADIRLVNRVFQRRFGRPPRLLREDFCGTANLACRFAELHAENRAWGIDLDPEPLAWGREHNVARLRADEASRVKLIEGNVLDVGIDPVDVTLALNFSYFIFCERDALLRYLRVARSTLGGEGLLVLDAYGGSDAQKTLEETREIDDFDYVWDQHRFNPIQNGCTNFIHFEFPDGSRMRRAFRYDWRLWSLPELRDLLAEAGFSASEVYWEGVDKKTGEGNDVFTQREIADDDPAWVAYLIGVV